MKQTHKLVIAAALIVAAGIAAFAADKPASKERVIRIESKGQVIAELHLLAPCKSSFDDATIIGISASGDATCRAIGSTLSGTLVFDGGQVVHLTGNAELGGKLEDLGLHTK